MFACEGGQILTCGLNDCMQLGLETTNKIVYTPTPVPLLSGVESYTMSFGGYLQPGQPSSPVASNGVMENRKAEFPRKDTDSSIHPLSDKPQSLITNSTIQNGEPIHFNTNNGQGHHPSAKTVLENDSEISPSVNGTGTHEGKPPPAGRPGYPEVANPISGRINITSNNIPNEPIIVSSTDNQASDLPNNPSVPHRKVSSTIRYQYTGKTNKLTCGKCCIVM
ncbi:unnamed protein product [Phytomonas sp. EM1]|nr:unnamed protein product [Phytomonas sp. EM1]|eukprot:CCW60600.1 unnamed protein product [Phytomonas sp. isolate EM1]